MHGLVQLGHGLQLANPGRSRHTAPWSRRQSHHQQHTFQGIPFGLDETAVSSAAKTIMVAVMKSNRDKWAHLFYDGGACLPSQVDDGQEGMDGWLRRRYQAMYHESNPSINTTDSLRRNDTLLTKTCGWNGR